MNKNKNDRSVGKPIGIFFLGLTACTIFLYVLYALKYGQPSVMNIVAFMAVPFLFLGLGIICLIDARNQEEKM